jgi:hypothetical protein
MIVHVTTISTSCLCGCMDYSRLLIFSVNGGCYVTDVKRRPLEVRYCELNMNCQSKEISQPEVMSSIQALVWHTWWGDVILPQYLTDISLVIV